MLNLQAINIELLKQGHEPTFEELYKSAYNALFFFSFQYIDEKPDAENLVQETFLSLWTNKESINCSSSNSLRAWLYSTLKNKCLNYLSKENSKQQFNSYQKNRHQADMLLLGQMDISQVTFDEIERLLQGAISVMPEQCRRVFQMSRFDYLSNKEIADKLNISAKAVEANMTRALKLVRIHLKDYLPIAALIGLI
ncbi:RNA polymerase sigma-70 factor [Carboxylicivirga sp. M1479]|uniref:RNA polymerase sigma-70 factor n=1 Tax=Carboxylicivirga sp. M1479 TaxID=2594476 RepID=UPI0011781FF7|nr:RNA polymerase sigma-70 factor [Carboxylicivirga sp. M1479]TRX71478.1 RNA polymerase sigma-70 factor [Carboxylicivirga sp. M1479]